MAITTAELLKALRAGDQVTSAAYDPAKQAEGYAKRLEGAGVDVAEATDDRGWFGKLVNLNQDQGFLGDVFEIIDRPLNAISAALMGEDIWASFSGTADEEYTYIDVLKNWGMDDTSATVLGMVGNIFADPIDLALATVGLITAPITSGASAAIVGGYLAAKIGDATIDVAQATNKVSDLMKAGKTFNKLEDVKDFLNGFGKTLDDKTVKSIFDGLQAEKAIKGLDRVEALHEAGKNLFKVQGDLNQYNSFGKFIKKAGAITSPIGYYNKLQDIGAGIATRRIGKLFNVAGEATYKAAANGVEYLEKLDIIRKSDIDNLRKSFDNVSTWTQRIFNKYSGVAEKAMKGLDDAKRAIMGDQLLVLERAIGGMAEGANIFAKGFDEYYQALLNHSDEAVRKLALKGKDHVKALTTSLIETGYSRKASTISDLVNDSILRQEKLVGVRFDKGVASIADDADTNVFSIGEGSTLSLAKKSSQADPSFNYDVTSSALSKAVKEASSSQPGVRKVLATSADTPGAKYANIATDKLEQIYKSKYPGQNVYIVRNPVNEAGVAGDIEVYLETSANGKKSLSMVSQFEVKGSNSGFRLTTLPPEDLTANPVYNDIVTAIERSFESGYNGKVQVFGIPDYKKKMAEYLDKHRDIIYVDVAGETYYITGSDLMDLAEKYQDQIATEYRVRAKSDFKGFTGGEEEKEAFKAKAARIQTVEDVDGKPVLGDQVSSLGANDQPKIGVAVTASYKGPLGKAYSRAYGDISVKIKQAKKGTDNSLVNFIKSRLSKYGMNVEQTSLLEMMVKAGGDVEDFILDEKSYNVFKDIISKDPQLRPLIADTTGVTIFERLDMANGEKAYQLNGEGKIAIQEILVKLNEDKSFSKVKAQLEALMDRPSFFDAEMLSDMDTLSMLPQTLAIQGEYNKFMNRIKSEVDKLGDVQTQFSKVFGDTYVRHSQNADVQKALSKYLSTKQQEEILGSIRVKVNDFKARRYNMSVYESNQLMDAVLKQNLDPKVYKDILSDLGTEQIKMFTEDLGKSALDFYTSMTGKKEQMTLLTHVIKSDMFTKQSDENPFPLIRPLRPNESKMGYVTVTKKQFTDQARSLAAFMEKSQGEDFVKSMQKFISEIGGDDTNMLIDANMFSMIGRLSQPEETMNSILKGIDWVNSVFKQTKLLTPGFHLRNTVGNYMNLALSNLSGNELAQLTSALPNYMSIGVRGKDLIAKAEKLGLQNLSELERSEYELFSEFVRSGFLNSSYGVNDLEDLLLKSDELTKPGARKAIGKAVGLSAAGNEYVDRMYRLALFDMARKNPAIYQRAGLPDAASYVRFVLFDPKDLSQVEKNVMRRIIPFYTFTKKNLMYQLKNITMNPKRYRNVNRILDMSYDFVGADQADAPEYQVDNMYIPIPFTNQDGEFITFKANLPQSDLNEWAEDPLRRLVASLTPILRAPYEVATNQQIYTGMPISEFEGQEGYKLPFLNRWQEYALSQTGLDAPVTSVYNLLTGNIGQSLGFGTTNLESAERSRAYDELNELKDIMNYYKQEGVRIPTIAELENQGQTSKLDAIMRAIGG